jgi:hypothetical protein
MATSPSVAAWRQQFRNYRDRNLPNTPAPTPTSQPARPLGQPGGRGRHHKAVRLRTGLNHQSNVYASSNSANPDRWGDNLQPKPPDTFRIAFQNCGGMRDEQNDLIRHFINDFELDVLGLAETNTDWSRVPTSSKIPNRFRGFWEHLHHRHSFLFQPRHYSASSYLVGGALALSVNDASHRVQQADSDHFGRWCWVHYEGQQGQGLRVLCGYRPCRSDGPHTAYSQLATAHHLARDHREPLAAFDQDLATLLDSWSGTNFHIIVMMDANHDVLAPAHHRIGVLTEVCTYRHGANGPPTISWGQKAIDGIWVSPALLSSQCGYLSFGEGTRSDHRALWIDLPMSIFGGSNLKTSRPTARRLKLEDPRIVERFITAYATAVKDLNLPKRIADLTDSVRGRLSIPQQEEFEAIDLVRTAAVLEAEKSCRKLRMGNIPWTPQLTQAQRILAYHRLCYRKSQGHSISTKTIYRAALRAGRTTNPVSLVEARTNLRKALDSYRRIKRTATQATRATYLQSLAVARAEAGNSDAEAVLKSLIRIEDQRYRFRVIKQVHQPAQRGGLRRVQRPLPDGSYEECTAKEDIEAACLAENDARFSQSSNTPFLQEPLLSDFGLLGRPTTIEQVLKGTYEPPPTADPYAQLLLQFLHRPPGVPTFDMVVTMDDFVHGWRRAKERTSAGPSKLHFGHFKAIAQHPDLAELEVSLLNILLKSGYSPSRWRKGLNVMLLKKPGCYDPATFRTILLYEADFNFVLKMMGRRMMRNAERASLIAPEQFGSRKNHTAICQVVNKVLTYDVSRLRHSPAAMCSNDAKSCYDRVVHSIAKASMMRLGTPSVAIDLMFETIQRLKHFIRTAYGDSEISFGGDPRSGDPPKHGVGQGNGCGPAIWAAVSTPALDMLRASGAGVDLRSAISSEVMRMAAYSLVDDTDLPQLASSEFDVNVVLQLIQRSADMWEGAIRATGGAIVPGKSFWYLIDFIFADDGSPRYAKIAQRPATLTVLDASGTRVPLERLECSEGRRTLGVRTAPDGNQRAEVAYLRQSLEQWADQIRTSGLDHITKWLNFTTTIMRKLAYPLPATTFTRHDCDEILRPLRSCLSALGFNRNYPTVLLHAPLSQLGLDIPDLYVSQGIEHVNMLLELGHLSNNITGSLLRGAIEQTKLEVGLGGSLFRQDLHQLRSVVTQSWIRSTWLFLQEYNLIVDEGTENLQLQRTEDSFLMAHFVSSGLSGNELRRLNCCRLYLSATTLADICTGDGTQISTYAWEGTPLEPGTRPGWPHQPRPPNWIWNEWRAALSPLLASRRRLKQPLGDWLPNHGRHWFYSPSDDRLYNRTNNLWSFLPRIPVRSRTRLAQTRFSTQHQRCETIPLDVQVATVSQKPSYNELIGSGPIAPTPPNNPPITLLDRLQTAGPGTEWATLDLTITDDGASIAAAIMTGSCIALSDGSVKDGIGTAAWVLEGSLSQHRILGYCHVPGSKDDQCSNRSEYAGIYALALAIRLICEHHDIADGSVELCCDGLGPLTRASHSDWVTHPNEQCFDLKEATRHQMAMCPVKWRFRHVRGHQDAKKASHLLDRYETLNCEMDANAKAFREQLHAVSHPSNRDWLVSGESWSLWIADSKICSDVPLAIRKACSIPPAKAYWLKKGRFGTGSPSMINWQHQDRAVRSSPTPRAHFRSKHASGFSGVGKKMQTMGFWSDAKCCRCDAPVETSEHVLRCPQEAASQVWETAIIALSKHLVSARTDPKITEAIVSALRLWRADDDIPTSHSNPLIQAALLDQHAIGWRSFLEGLPCNNWTTAQEAYAATKRPDLPFSPGLWASQLIRWVWEIPWSLWTQRNDWLHRAGTTDPAMAQVDAGIQYQLELGTTGLATRDTDFFNKFKTTILTKHPSDRRAWLTRITAARANDSDRASRRVMARFLASAS